MVEGSRKGQEGFWEVITDRHFQREMLSSFTQGSGTGVQVCLTMEPVLVSVQDVPSRGAFRGGSRAPAVIIGPELDI